MKDKISNFELVLLFVSATMGVRILSLPRNAVEGAGVDGIVAVALAGILFTSVTFLFSTLAVKFKDKTMLEFSEGLVGKFVTRIFAILLSFQFIYFISIEVRIIGQTVKQFLLFNTPLEIIMISILMVSAIAVNYGIVAIARIGSNYSITTILMLLFILILSLGHFDIENLYPLFTNSPRKIIGTAFDLTVGYLATGIILFIMPLVQKPKDTVRISVFSLLGITLLYTLTTAISVGEFGITPNQYIVQPTAIMSKGVFLSGFLERIDIIFMVFWILAAYLAITIRWFIASYTLSKIVSQKSYTIFTFLSLPLIYICALFPQNNGQVERVASITPYLAWFIIVPISIILYSLSFLKKGGAKTNENS